jgi:UDP-N-acetylglucosamine diphosphorylase/glucosamine-1-phosphate N-acetyltransferase
MMKNGEKRCSAIILAAGKGTRMKSDQAKVLHAICSRPMLAYPVDVARAAEVEKIIVVVGHQAELVREAFQNQGLIFVEQREQLGTGHAVLQAKEIFSDYEGDILILCGDVPLLKLSTVKNLIEHHVSEGAAVTVLTTILSDPAGYGRIVKEGESGAVLKIVEDKEATSEEKAIREINTGIYCVAGRFLFDAVAEIGNDNVQKEYYLTDMIEIAINRGLKVASLVAPDSDEVMGINTPEGLERASAVKMKDL